MIKNTLNLIKLKNKYQGKHCFILGNGPSLKKHDLAPLINQHVFAVNWFVLHPIFPQLKKCFYCISDPQFWDYGKGFFPELVNNLRLSKNLTTFFERSAYKSYRSIQPPLKHPVFFIKLNRRRKASLGYFSSKIWLSINWGSTVIMDLCLPIAFYLGFKKIYLLGCDCDYQLDKDKAFNHSYFFQLTKTPKKYRQHLIKHYQPSSTNLPIWMSGYQTINKAASQYQVKIYNAGIGGKLEVFPRVKYQSLFK